MINPPRVYITMQHEVPLIRAIQERQVMDIKKASNNSWVISLAHFRPDEDEPYNIEAMILSTAQLNAIAFFVSEVRLDRWIEP